MVKKIGKFFAYLLFFMATLIYFLPKISLYYFLEKELKPYAIIISSEDTKDRGFSLKIEHANLSLKGIESANINEIDLKLFLLYNSILLNEVALSNTLESFIPLQIHHVDIMHHIFNPLFITAQVSGEFGEADISFDIIKRSLHLELKASKIMKRDYKNTLRTLKKTKQGEYIYDKNI